MRETRSSLDSRGRAGSARDPAAKGKDSPGPDKDFLGVETHKGKYLDQEYFASGADLAGKTIHVEKFEVKCERPEKEEGGFELEGTPRLHAGRDLRQRGRPFGRVDQAVEVLRELQARRPGDGVSAAFGGGLVGRLDRRGGGLGNDRLRLQGRRRVGQGRRRWPSQAHRAGVGFACAAESRTSPGTSSVIFWPPPQSNSFRVIMISGPLRRASFICATSSGGGSLSRGGNGCRREGNDLGDFTERLDSGGRDFGAFRQARRKSPRDRGVLRRETEGSRDRDLGRRRRSSGSGRATHAGGALRVVCSAAFPSRRRMS